MVLPRHSLTLSIQIIHCDGFTGLNATGGNIEKKWCGESCDNSTASVAAEDTAIGALGAILAIVLFGSNFIPVKKYDTGDGEYWVHFHQTTTVNALHVGHYGTSP